MSAVRSVSMFLAFIAKLSKLEGGFPQGCILSYLISFTFYNFYGQDIKMQPKMFFQNHLKWTPDTWIFHYWEGKILGSYSQDMEKERAKLTNVSGQQPKLLERSLNKADAQFVHEVLKLKGC